MLSGLVATVALGFVSGPAAGGKAVTEMRLSYRALIVGNWELRLDIWPDNGGAYTAKFHRNGHFKMTRHFRSGAMVDWSGSYRVDGQRLTLQFPGGEQRTFELVQLDRRVLSYRISGSSYTPRFRRR
jgi:hypothetical protein